MVLQWLLLVVLLACSGIVSGSETALFGLSRLELRDFAAAGGRLKRQAQQLMLRPRRVLMTVLIANTAVNVLFFAISFVTFKPLSKNHPVAASLGGVAALLAVILFGEVLPKAAARAHAARLAPLVAPLVQGLQTALGPIRLILRVSLIEPITRLACGQSAAGRTHAASEEVSIEELQALVEMSARQGVLDSAENRMLHQIVALPEISVRSVMRPRVDVIAVPLDADLGAVCTRMQQAGLTKLPVYGRDLDDVRGLVYAREVYPHVVTRTPAGRGLPESTGGSWRAGTSGTESGPTRLGDLIRPVNFVPEQSNLLQVIEHFQASRSQLAMVVDEYGGVAGLVTLEDVLEQIVGELSGAEQPTEPAVEPIDENTYRLAGDLNVRDWAQRFGVAGLGSSRFQTVAGLVLAELGRLPREGDSVRIHNLTLTVERLAGRRIGRILLTRGAGRTANREASG